MKTNVCEFHATNTMYLNILFLFIRRYTLTARLLNVHELTSTHTLSLPLRSSPLLSTPSLPPPSPPSPSQSCHPQQCWLREGERETAIQSLHARMRAAAVSVAAAGGVFQRNMVA